MHEQCATTDTNASQWTLSVSGCACSVSVLTDNVSSAKDATVPPSQTTSGWEGHSPSARRTDRESFALNELSAWPSALVSSGASCSVRTRTVDQHVGRGERAFLPALRPNRNASGIDCGNAGILWVLARGSPLQRLWGPPAARLTWTNAPANGRGPCTMQRAANCWVSPYRRPSGHRSAAWVGPHRRERSGHPCRKYQHHHPASGRSRPCSRA